MKPEHYKDMKIDVIDFCTANDLNFNIGNVVKYICRYKKKDGKKDLLKALDYLNRIKESKKRKKEKINLIDFCIENDLDFCQDQIIYNLIDVQLCKELGYDELNCEDSENSINDAIKIVVKLIEREIDKEEKKEPEKCCKKCTSCSQYEEDYDKIKFYCTKYRRVADPLACCDYYKEKVQTL